MVQIAEIDDPCVKLPYWRGLFIEAYASLEASLASILMGVSDLNFQGAYSVFFRVTNAKSRITIIEDFLNARLNKADYAVFHKNWATLLREVNRLTGLRNGIIHWRVVNPGTKSICLANPANFSGGSYSPDDIERSTRELWLVDHILMRLGLGLCYSDKRAVLDIFMSEPIDNLTTYYDRLVALD